jgi:hypothetical protein
MLLQPLALSPLQLCLFLTLASRVKSTTVVRKVIAARIFVLGLLTCSLARGGLGVTSPPCTEEVCLLTNWRDALRVILAINESLASVYPRSLHWPCRTPGFFNCSQYVLARWNKGHSARCTRSTVTRRLLTMLTGDRIDNWRAMRSFQSSTDMIAEVQLRIIDTEIMIVR